MSEREIMFLLLLLVDNFRYVNESTLQRMRATGVLKPTERVSKD